ncbi:MAG: hypothetical protein LAT55_04875 [Opitutales bacterium]|nr:hypothetical protein [Opitutales bacterium]
MKSSPVESSSEKGSGPSGPEDRKEGADSYEYGGELDAKARRARNIIIAVAVLFSLMPGILFLIITFLR